MKSMFDEPRPVSQLDPVGYLDTCTLLAHTHAFFAAAAAAVCSVRTLATHFSKDDDDVGVTHGDADGAFMLHCGALAMGCPGEGDDHQLHGELPNAPYQRAWLHGDEDIAMCVLGVLC